jgi:hypothetical protein
MTTKKYSDLTINQVLELTGGDLDQAAKEAGDELP